MDANNLLGVPATLLPAEPEVLDDLANLPDEERALEAIASKHPTSSLAWAELADCAYRNGEIVEAYAFARVGYHRGLDALRKNGWRGQGPVPWSHEPNRGVLRAFWQLRRAAEEIGETGEPERLTALLADADPSAAGEIEREVARQN
ncbi:DUF3151 domain-containing protein [Gulosibacter macacae]|uniref:DUF3151 domain-containing protein n=1 Tax=Gulosibacter macacae TaxID=2488791 RepID=A0A3P3VXC4_9MICO|nr:DUF3151 domain-containing protein [Gulosibacter macacae]RRJ86997.1 DUF3151 domain-containing protein [Gulosibacter macacae]